MNPADELKMIATSLNIAGIKRHIFLCADQAKPNCCSKDVGLLAWEHLKSRLDDLGLSKAGGIFRTKANCLRVCRNGPIAVVYPDNTWYHSVSIEALDRIIDEHLIGGRPVKEYIIY